MSFDEGAVYHPLTAKNGKGELESIEILLPPLTVQRPERTGLRRWRRVLLIAPLIVSVIILAIIAVTLAVVLTKHPDTTSQGDHIPLPRPEKEKTRGKDLEVDLQRVYNRIMDQHSLQELKSIFNYYRSELADVRNVKDLRDFLVLLKSEGLNTDLGDVNDTDIDFVSELTGQLSEWYSYLDELRTNLTKYEYQNHLGDVYERKPGVELDTRKMNERRRLFEDWRKPMVVVKTLSRVTFKKKVVLLSEVRELLKVDPSLAKPEIYIFASCAVYLDADLILPGTSIALISPRWLFLRGIKIFISGLNAVEHEPNTARLGARGLPGYRGGNGGHFIGIGNIKGSYLRVYNDGSNGGDGQHGADGRNGTDATQNGYNKSDAFRCKVHVRDVTNKFGEVTSYYEVYDEVSCGGNGTDGGAPGQGGEGGLAMFVNVSNGEVKFDSGRRGADGRAGKGGASGAGAANGCYFIAEKIKNVLYPVTVRKCGFQAPSGYRGRDGYGANITNHANTTFFGDAIREYRAFAREEYLSGDDDILRFLDKLDDLPYFSNVTRVSDFLAEMDVIDRKIEFYESLNRRLDKALKTSNDTVLPYLRALSYGKMLTLKHGFDTCMVVDLDVYLDTVSSDIHNISWGSLSYNDRAIPVLLSIVKGKVEYLNDSLDRWITKADNIAGRQNRKTHQSSDLKKMARITSIAAQVLKPLISEITNNPGENPPVRNSAVIKKFDPVSDSGVFTRHQNRLLRELMLISSGSAKGRLKEIRRLLVLLNDLVDPESEVSDFPFELDYLESALELSETVREKQAFEKYIEDIQSVSSADPLVKNLRERISGILVLSRYKDALSVFRQWVFPHGYAYDDSMLKNITLEKAQNGINLLRKWVKEYKSTVTPYDKYVREATFSSENCVGEYYKWYNSDIRSDITELLKGRKVLLTAEVENMHMYSKGAIKFKTVRLELQSRSGVLNKYRDLLKTVQVEMRHSGYSYYFYNGQTYLQTGEGFDLHYSYELGADGQPVNCNMVFKKLMNGPAIFSPYTTWTVQLKSVPDGLIRFADDIDVALVGFGTYVQADVNV